MKTFPKDMYETMEALIISSGKRKGSEVTGSRIRVQVIESPE